MFFIPLERNPCVITISLEIRASPVSPVGFSMVGGYKDQSGKQNKGIITHAKLLQKAGKIKEDYLGLIKLAIKKSGDEKESCHFSRDFFTEDCRIISGDGARLFFHVT